MNPTSKNPRGKFPISSGQNLQLNNWAVYVALAVCVVVGFSFTLILYASFGHNPLNRLGYGFFVSLLPAVGSWIFLKFTRLLVSWLGVAIIYVLLFLLIFTSSLLVKDPVYYSLILGTVSATKP